MKFKKVSTYDIWFLSIMVTYIKELLKTMVFNADKISLPPEIIKKIKLVYIKTKELEASLNGVVEEIKK